MVEKASLKKKVGVAAITGAMLCSLGIPGLAMAVPTGEQIYDSEGAGAWDPATNVDKSGGGGEIQIIYSTTGGTWEAPGEDPTDPSDNEQHPNGTYTVEIPRLIKYDSMDVGAVDTSDDYSVLVRGAIPYRKTVKLGATADATLNPTGDITPAVTQGKQAWSDAECLGPAADPFNPDGSLKGTSTTDNITLKGTATKIADYAGVVTYTAELVDAS